MKMSIIVATLLSAWAMAIIYYQVEIGTGIELKPLLYVAIITMTAGIYLGCRENKETLEEEA